MGGQEETTGAGEARRGPGGTGPGQLRPVTRQQPADHGVCSIHSVAGQTGGREEREEREETGERDKTSILRAVWREVRAAPGRGTNRRQEIRSR